MIIGSYAIKHWFPDFSREPKDLDIIKNNYYKVNNPSNLRIEYLSNPILEEKYKDSNIEFISPNDLYTLKVSHVIGWNINWEKHMFDIQFLKSKGCVLDLELFNKLYSFWSQYHSNNKRSDLKMTAEDFFDNAVNFPYEHDYLHTLLNPYPTYNKVLKDGAEVEVCEDKFNQLSFQEKCDLVTEEVMIMAFERYQKIGYRSAYSKMLKKFIINHAPIWEGIFIIENFITLHKPNFDYFKKIQIQLI